MLSDSHIKLAYNDNYAEGGPIVPEKVLEEDLKPASIDMKLGKELLVQKYSGLPKVLGTLFPTTYRVLNIINPDVFPINDMICNVYGDMKRITMGEQGYLLAPGKFILCSTEDKIWVPPTLAARVEGRSTIGRCGVMVHITAGFIDPGFRGNITLEIKNVGNIPFMLRPGMRICQICFVRVEGKVSVPYDANSKSKYMFSCGTVPPKKR